MFLANGASDGQRGNLCFCISKNAIQNMCFLTLFDFHFAELCFWVVGVTQNIAELCVGSMVPPKKCGIMFLINGAAEKNAEFCF